MAHLSQTVVIGNTNVETEFFQQVEFGPAMMDRRETAIMLCTLRSRASSPGTLTLRARLNGLVTPLLAVSFTPPVNLNSVMARLSFEVAVLPTVPNEPSAVVLQVRGLGEYVNASNVLVPFPISSGANPPIFNLNEHANSTLRYTWQWQTANPANVLTVFSHQQGRLL